jgi:hypothetical protein
MGNKMQLTSVKVPEDLFEQFKIACVKYKFSVQKLTERSMFLYLTQAILNCSNKSSGTFTLVNCILFPIIIYLHINIYAY